eukprot:Opistho-2@95843
MDERTPLLTGRGSVTSSRDSQLDDVAKDTSHLPQGRNVAFVPAENVFLQNDHPITLNVQDLRYTVVVDDGRPPIVRAMRKLASRTCQKGGEYEQLAPETKEIVRGVTFEAKPGHVLAILGSSGSGKTSLLDVLACRQSGGTVTGHVTFNGVPVTKSLVREYGAYVMQDDRLLPHLTVRETLTYVALLRLPKHLPRDQKIRRAEIVIAELGLRHVGDSIIGGGHVRGISGGERRRVSIGVQLLLSPSVIFLDEPTSGLDAFTAANIVETLASLAKSGRTVVFTIHQPRSDIYALFDSVLLLAQGKTVFFGPAKRMIQYFGSAGYECPKFTNPCDYYLDVCTVDRRTIDSQSDAEVRITSLIDAYDKNGPSFLASSALASTDGTASTTTPAYAPLQARTSDSIGAGEQFVILYQRASRNLVQGWQKLLSEFAITCMMAILIGGIYWGLTMDQLGWRDRFGLFFIMCALFPFMIILDTIAKFEPERPSFYSERQDGLYDVLPYYAAKIFSELPVTVVSSLVYSVPIYWLAGLKDSTDAFLTYIGIVLLALYCSVSMAFAVATMFPNFQIACFNANVTYTIFLLAAGFIVNIDTLWPGVKWISYISYIRRSFEALCVNEFPGLQFTCDGTGGNTTAPCPVPDGQTALAVYSVSDADVGVSSAVISALIVFWHLVAFLSLKYKNQKPQSR